MDKVVEYLLQKCGLTKESIFADLGGGVGKPAYHVAIKSGCKSVSIEYGPGRAKNSTLIYCKMLPTTETEGSNHLRVAVIHEDLWTVDTYTGVTHVYGFDQLFDPDLMEKIAKSWNQSDSSTAWILTTKMTNENPQGTGIYRLKAELVEKIIVKMTGSASEQKTVYVYRRPKVNSESSSSSIIASTPQQPDKTHIIPDVITQTLVSLETYTLSQMKQWLEAVREKCESQLLERGRG
jgi:hypothetical protein